MKTTIETINGKPMTVVWHGVASVGNFTKEYADLWRWEPLNDGSAILIDIDHIATALPALPRHPKHSDAPLLYRYMAEGIVPRGNYYDTHAGKERRDHSALSFMTYMYDCNNCRREITHATDSATGERVSVAISGGE